MKLSKDGLRGDRCICRACGERFNSTAAFDAHRTGTPNIKAINYGRRCLLDFEMERKGMTRNEKGFWLTPRKTPRKPANTPSGIPAYEAPGERAAERLSSDATSGSSTPGDAHAGLSWRRSA